MLFSAGGGGFFRRGREYGFLHVDSEKTMPSYQPGKMWW